MNEKIILIVFTIAIVSCSQVAEKPKRIPSKFMPVFNSEVTITKPIEIKQEQITIIPEPEKVEIIEKKEEIPQHEPKIIKEEKQKITFIWPAKGTISSGYGKRQGRMHHGIDITKDNGKNVVASAMGIVEFSGRKNTFGKLIIINHGQNTKTLYAHNSKVFVRVNTKVKQGQLIARMGSTGKTKGPHLHFEIRIDGKSKNPLKYLPVR